MKNDILLFIKRTTAFIFALVACIAVLFLAITQLATPKFRSSYQYVINYQYKHLMETKSPKIVVVGGSSCAFGLDGPRLEEQLEMPVCNMGLHASIGSEFVTQMALDSLNEGDILVLAYEYILYSWSTFAPVSPELVMTGIDNNLCLYTYLSKEQIPDMIRYFPTYVFKKLDSIDGAAEKGPYSVSAFDDSGNMIYERSSDVALVGDIIIYPASFQIDPKVEKYINHIAQAARDKGAKVVLTFPPVLNERFLCSQEDILQYEHIIDEQLEVTRISSVSDYVFPREYMYDTVFHCNSVGARVRTEQLAEDILAFMEGSDV